MPRIRNAGLRSRAPDIGCTVAATLGSALLAERLTHMTGNQFVKLLVVIASVVLAGLALTRPRWALLAVPAIAVFDRPITVLGGQVSLALLALAAFAPAMARRWHTRITPTPARWAIVAFLAGSALACFFATDLPAAVLGVVTWSLVFNYVLGGLGMIAADRRLLLFLAEEVATLGAVVAALGYLQGKGHYTIVGPPFAPDRIDSSFGWYSNYGNFVAIATVVGVGATMALVSERRIAAASVIGTCSMVSAYGVFISLSRGAILCLGAGLAVILITRLHRPVSFITSLFLVGMVAFAAWTLTPTATATQFINRFRQEQGGDPLRFAMQAAGEALLARTPQGIGFGGFRAAAAQGATFAGSDVLAHSHELFVQIGLDSGWLGLAGFLVLTVYAAASGGWGAWTRRHSPYALGFTGALVGVLLQGLNDYFFFENASVIAFSLVVLGALGGNVTDPVSGTEAAAYQGVGATTPLEVASSIGPALT